MAGFAFKIAAVPFHMWAPDVYEGAPTPITLFLSTVSKIAGFSILLRFMFAGVIQPASLSHNWGIILAVVSVLTMTAGNLLAITQHNIKRLLAYSSIAQSGYMLMAVAAVGIAATFDSSITSSFLYYLTAFALAEVAVFTVIIIASRQTDNDDISDYAGLGKRSPLLACAMTLGLLSLMGLPPLVGFMGKFFVLSQAAQHNLIWLVIVAVVNSVISAYYYLKILRAIWADAPASTTSLKVSLPPKIALFVACAGVLLLGILPALLNNATEWGAQMWQWQQSWIWW
jgi:NADH-quinone oxidoreductase subunit N